MKFLVLAALVAVAAANIIPLPTNPVALGQKRIQVDTQGNILISSLTTGNRVEIIKTQGLNGQRLVQIVVVGPTIPNAQIQVQDPVVQSTIQTPLSLLLQQQQISGDLSLGGLTQGDILSQILTQYQGVVPEQVFRQILTQIQQAVLGGQVGELVYGILVVLDNLQEPLQSQIGLSGLQNQIVGSPIVGLQGLQNQIGLSGLQGQIVGTPVVGLQGLQNQIGLQGQIAGTPVVGLQGLQNQIGLQGQIVGSPVVGLEGLQGPIVSYPQVGGLWNQIALRRNILGGGLPSLMGVRGLNQWGQQGLGLVNQPSWINAGPVQQVPRIGGGLWGLLGGNGRIPQTVY